MEVLGYFASAGYDASSEAYCRIPIDCVLTAAKLAYMESMELPIQEHRTPTPQPAPKPLRIYPEMDLSVVIDDHRDPNFPKKIKITGKADWALSHDRRADSGAGSALLAVEAKSMLTIGQAEAQLLTYLATMRALRRQKFKKNDFVQGFYADGSLFRFMAIDYDGTVLASKFYERGYDLLHIFNWTRTMIEAAARSSPSTSPAKPGVERDTEIENFRPNIFLRFYTPSTMNESSDEFLEEVVLDKSMVIDELFE